MTRNTLELSSLALEILKKRYPDSKDPLAAWCPDRPPYADHLPDLEILRKELENLEKRDRKIVLYSHDDMDGITGLFIGIRILSGEGFKISFIIPDRNTDNYGLLPARMQNVLEKDDLLLTVDFGCSSVEGVDWALKHGARVVVTDHHTLNPPLPEAHGLINPQAVGGPSTELSGCGVLYAALTEIYPRWQKDPDILFANVLGTVSDRVPIYGWNRHSLWKFEQIKRSSLPAGLRIMLDSWPIRKGSWTAAQVRQQVTSVIGKGLEAGIDEMVSFMSSDNEEYCRARWALMREKCDNRVQLLNTLVSKAMMEKDPQADAMGLTLVYLDESIAGMGGSIASKLCSIYGRGAIIVSKRNDGTITGEARSLGGWNMAEFLVGMRDFFTSAGGHAKAAGFSLENGDWKTVREMILTKMTNFQVEPVPSAHIDLHLESLPDPADLEMLAPFGPGFPPPAVIVSNKRYLLQFGRGTSFWAISDETGD